MYYTLYSEEQLQNELARLPKGYISRKRINGKERFYLQWRESGHMKSRYLKAEELETIQEQIRSRKEIENELRRRQMQWTVQEAPGPMYGSPVMYLKWADEVVGEIDASYNLRFRTPAYNETLALYTKGAERWTRQQLADFLSERIPSPSRRDIEGILRRCGLSSYDPLQLGIATKGMNARDLLWLSTEPEERFEDAVTEVFRSVFLLKTDLQGDSVDTPEGYNMKRYGVWNGRYGIFKQRMHPFSTDVESEVAVSKLGKLLGVPCCDCFRTGEDSVFSAFHYDFARESIVHFRRLIASDRSANEFQNLLAARPQYFADFVRTLALDFLTRQDDRHLSNLAVKISPEGEQFYPLYDNGRSLFYEDTEQTVARAVQDIQGYATAFGPSGTYWDQVQDIKRMGVEFSRLLHIDVTREQIRAVLTDAGLSGYRLEGSLEWICKSLEVLRA